MSDQQEDASPRTQPTEGTFQKLAQSVEHLNDSVVGHTSEVQMLRAEVAEMQTRAELIESRAQLIANQMRLDRKRNKADRRRFLTLFTVMVLALLALVIVGLSNRYYNQVLVNCTTAGHECYDKGQEQAAKFTKAIIDQDGNGVPDNAQILARVSGQPDPIPPTTTTTAPKQIIQTKQEIGWQVTIFLILLGIAVVVLILLQVQPGWFKRDSKSKHRRADDPLDDEDLEALDWWSKGEPGPEKEPPPPPAGKVTR